MLHLIVTVTGAHWSPDLRRARTGDCTGGRATLTVAASGSLGEPRISRKTITLFTLSNIGVWLVACSRDVLRGGKLQSVVSCLFLAAIPSVIRPHYEPDVGVGARNKKRILFVQPQIQEQIVEVVLVMLQELVPERVVEQNASWSRSWMCHRFWSRMLK